MKKNFFYALGMVAMLCGCSSGTVEEEENRMIATGFVGGLGDATTSISYYDFKEEDSGCKISGFSGLEDFGRWSEVDSCNISFDNIVPNSDLTIRINVFLTGPANEPAKYSAYANGKYVGSGETYHGVIYINVPSEAVGDSENLNLGLKMKNAQRPIDVDPEKKDTRLLGLAISNITIFGYALEGFGEEEDAEE